MAINIEWQALPTQTSDNTNKARLYPRMTENETVDTQAFCEKVARYTSLKKGVVQGLLCDMADVIAKLLREGKTIDLEDLGTFRLSIGTDANVTPDMPYNKRQVTVRGINFQPHKGLMESIGTPDFRVIPRNASPIVMSQGQIQETLLDYFKTHDSITRLQFEKLCKLKRATANVRLKKLVASGFLIKVGSNRDTTYQLKTAKQ